MRKFRLAEAAANAAADAVTALLDNGRLRIYSGTQPAGPEAPARGTLLAELAFSSDAFALAVGGVATARAIEKERAARANGVATWFRAVAQDGTPVFDGSVGVAGADLNLSNVNIQRDAEVAVQSMTYIHPQE